MLKGDIAAASVWRPRLCFALPGINYAEVTSNVIPARALARALEARFDVTFAVRSFVDPPPADLRCAAILNRPDFGPDITGSARTTWLGGTIREELAYLRRLRHFARQTAPLFDIVIERQWRHAGLLTAAYHAHGVPAGFCTEGEIYLRDPPDWRALPRRRLGYETLRTIMRASRRSGFDCADFVICETAELRDATIRRRGPGVAGKLAVIPPGVATDVFKPFDRSMARAALGIAANATILVYVGALNGSIQSPDKVIRGLAKAGRKDVELHILGKGDKQQDLENLARSLHCPAVFHGYRPQSEAALFIAAADVCLAPYRMNRYEHGVFTSGSCKVPEYLACGRPVLTIPCERMRFLTDEGAFGFLIADDPETYARFFAQHLTAEALSQREAALGRALQGGALRVGGRVLSWADAAEQFAQLIMPVLERRMTVPARKGASTAAR